MDSDNDSSNSVDIDLVGDAGHGRDVGSVEGGEESGSVSSDDEDSDSESVSSEDEMFIMFIGDLWRVKSNAPHPTIFEWGGYYHFIEHFANEKWEEIGRDISNNTHLTDVVLEDDALNDEKISYLFRGLTRSSSIQQLWLRNNGLSMTGVRSIMPFLQNANNLRTLALCGNNLQPAGFHYLVQALRGSPIEELYCEECGIDSIEIETNNCFLQQLKLLSLSANNINADGCREITKLLQGEDSMLEHLHLFDNNFGVEGITVLANALRSNATLTDLVLNHNEIDDGGVAVLANALRSNTTLTTLRLENNEIGDEGVAILVDALQGNASLKTLHLVGNDGISDRGEVMLLKLVNDISSINATMQSNHTLTDISVGSIDSERWRNPTEIDRLIKVATQINQRFENNPEAAGREKVILTQLHSANRAALTELQGVNHSVYSEIKPLHLPEVLSLVGEHHGQGELFAALKSLIAGVISIVDRE